MKSTLLLVLMAFIGVAANAQTGCIAEWKKVFAERGAYSVADDMHRNVYISFIEDNESYCVLGKARVENGKIVAVFLQYEDETYELMDMKLVNKEGRLAGIENGISEEIINEEGKHFYVIFVDKLKPKKKEYKTVGGPPVD